MKFIKQFSDITSEDVNLVGGKNASLGQMIRALSKENIRVPQGFAITSDAYWYYLKENSLLEPIKKEMSKLTDIQDLQKLREVGENIRELIENGILPENLKQEIAKAYEKLSEYYKQDDADVAVRSSATAEDLPDASFAGQQETFLNIKGIDQVLEAYKKSMASLFTNRAIVYRERKGFDHFKVALSTGIQKMVRSDKASAGVSFTLDTESGFANIVQITSGYGLGENVVKGTINPDEFHVFKTTLKAGYKPIVQKSLGSKKLKAIYTDSLKNPIKNIDVSLEKQRCFSLNDEEILELARMSVSIEDYYSKKNNKWTPMDIEWAKDGIDGKLYIVQARPETIHSQLDYNQTIVRYNLKTQNPEIIITGKSVGEKIGSGKARILNTIDEADEFKAGDILVTTMTDPDWVPIMKKASAIVTDKGGRTSHAAIVSRELGVPAIIGTNNATEKIEPNSNITVDCSQGSTGYIYKNKLDFDIETITLKDIPKPPVDLLLNIGDPDQAYKLSFLPTNGVGLARLEFIFASKIQIHPMAITNPECIIDKDILNKIKDISCAYNSPQDYFIDTLSQSIGTIAAAFYPRTVVIRLSDLKSNEYKNLIGGKYFEPNEENPMLGFRGAARYCNPSYKPSFELECKSIYKAINTMGLNNITIMVPFIRSQQEACCTLDILKNNGLKRSKDLKIIMMSEIPSNVIEQEKYACLFDGFSIGSNDLTQMTLGVDRESDLISDLFNEKSDSIKYLFKMAIEKAKKQNSYISICGQAPSDYPEIADFLIEHKIDAISLNSDSILPFLQRLKNI